MRAVDPNPSVVDVGFASLEPMVKRQSATLLLTWQASTCSVVKNYPIRATERLGCNKRAGSTVLFADSNSSCLPL
jgi:hypothetical protein